MYFNANCNILGSCALRIVPKFELLILLPGLLKLTWLVELKNSKRNCKRCASRIRKVRLRPTSMSRKFGPRSELQPALPNAPIALAANALGFSQTRVLRSRTYGLPTISGRSLFSPVRELSCPEVGVKGNPLCTETIGESCQSLSSVFARR